MAEPVLRGLPSRALRIALLTHSVNPRGGVVHTVSLAEALHDQGHDVTVLAPATPGQTMFRPLRCGLSLVAVPATPPADVAEMVEARRDAFIGHLRRLIAERPFEVLHAQDSISGNALATLRQQHEIDGFVRTVHHLDTFDDARLMAWQQRAFAEASQVLCVSAGWCGRLLLEHGIEAIEVQNGVDTQRFNPRPAASDAALLQRLGLRAGAGSGGRSGLAPGFGMNAPLLLAVGGIEARKNTLAILRALVLLRRQQPGAQLVIAGGASLLDHGRYQAAFEAERQALLTVAGGLTGPDLADAVRITGPLDDALMPALYRAADVLLMPSLTEGFGLAVLEALASGTPVVASHRPPFTEYLAPGESNGVCWADPAQPASIAAAALRALQPGRAQALAAALPEVCRRYNWPASARRHAAIYRAHLALRASRRQSRATSLAG